MSATPVRKVHALVPAEVLDRARRQLGDGVTAAEAVRHALALVAGVDLADYPVRPPGRPASTWTPEDRAAMADRTRLARARARAGAGERVPA